MRYDTETDVTDQACHLIQSQYTDTVQTNPGTGPKRPDAWQVAARVYMYRCC